MTELYTPAVERAIELAQRLAAQLQHAETEPGHLLQALLQEEEGRAFVLLTSAGVTAIDIRRQAPQVTAAFADVSPARSLSQTSHTLLRQARALARELTGEKTISSELLLLALLKDLSLRQALETVGLHFADLEAQVLDLVQGPALALEEPLELGEITERLDAARIIDASANRAREALRVLEDYGRFVLDDAFLSQELKTLRHALREILEHFSTHELLAARETLRDVGTSLSTRQERERHALTDVVQANLKRLQEALRSLEEYGKLDNPTLGQALEQLRYRSYTLERMLLLGQQARHRLAQVRLYVLVTGSLCHGSLEWTIREAAAGGAQIIQLREKQLPDRELLERARQVRRWTRAEGILFIMNDRPDIARLVEADGVHLGQEELPVKEARRLLGPQALIGVSTHNREQVQTALRDGASYIGVGPTFPSTTKEFADFPGLEFVRQTAAETSLPAYVIGGVTLANLPEVLAAGGRRIAVSHALCRSETPQALARALRQLLDAV